MRGRKRHIKKWAKQHRLTTGSFGIQLGTELARKAYTKVRSGGAWHMEVTRNLIDVSSGNSLFNRYIAGNPLWTVELSRVLGKPDGIASFRIHF